MKGHLKQLQRKVIRSTRRKAQKAKSENDNKEELRGEETQIYREQLPADQQVPRAPTRQSYH